MSNFMERVTQKRIKINGRKSRQVKMPKWLTEYNKFLQTTFKNIAQILFLIVAFLGPVALLMFWIFHITPVHTGDFHKSNHLYAYMNSWHIYLFVPIFAIGCALWYPLAVIICKDW